MNLPPPQILPYLIEENESAHKAYYHLSLFNNHKIMIVVDKNWQAIGILTPGDFKKIKTNGYDWLDNKLVGEICNKDFQFISSEDDTYSTGRNIFAMAGIKILDIPILDKNRVPVDILARWQAFYKEYYDEGKLFRQHYAHAIMLAAQLGRARNYLEISVIEFGVAGGTGLILAELYAAETTRLTGVQIQIYGFDMGSGLPRLNEGDNYAAWIKGDYPMQYEKLSKQLHSAKLVIGDIQETTKAFFVEYAPAPVGAMLIDVDLYSSTLPILNMLLESDIHYLPFVYMYFDDIGPMYEFEGEQKAIKEFNAKSRDIKIAPEGVFDNILEDRWETPWFEFDGRCSPPNYKLKICKRYRHEKFTTERDKILMLNMGL